jgi:hypothetical protein
LNPSDYYRSQYRGHFQLFWNSLEEKGSCSRARAHQQENFWGHRLRSDLSLPLKINGGCFSVGDLFLSPQYRLPDHLVDIPKTDHINFLCSLFYNILIDQVMFTHHQQDYWRFRLGTYYPKMDETIGWARTLMMANPYEIFGEQVLSPRGIDPSVLLERFIPWAAFIAQDLHKYIDANTIGTTNWKAIRESMLTDYDCIRGELGAILRHNLLQEV